MVNLALKYKKEIFIILILFAFYFLFRLPNLTLQPIFADEAIYIRWAQVMRSEPTLRFLPLSDGKTPLFMWAMIPLFKIFEDPLFAGRFLSVMSGFVTLIGVLALAWRVFGIKTALWASFIYVVVPYTVFFDRMALVDAMLSAFTVWALFFATLLAQKVRLDLAMILGFILGGAWLTKTPAVLNLFLLPASILAFKKSKEDKYSSLKLFFFWLIAIFIALLMYNALRLGPNFHLLSSRNADYVFSPVELLGRPLDPFIPHFRDISDWFPKLLTWPVLILGGTGVIWVIKEKNKLGFVVLLWALIPLLLEMAFLRTFTARYLLPSIPLILIFAGYGISKISNFKFQISNNFLILILSIVLTVPALHFNYQLLTSSPPDSLPKEERKGYFEGWTAGYGLKEIAQFLTEQNKTQKVVVGTEGFFGTLPDGLYIYLDKAGISIIGSHATISAQIRNAAKDNLTFFVGNKNNLEGAIDNVRLIKEYPKAKAVDGKQDSTVLYQVLPKD
ncbi:glycosyltransferase family 39 protein [Candidatus Daviesbacteria bacterium]|nr:glycosyltransferase family 39 protein [Candidatus Daviesbacteria bacterium]